MSCTPSPIKKKGTFFYTHPANLSGKKKKDVLVHALLEDLTLPSHVPVHLMQEENVRLCWLGLPQIHPRAGLTGSDLVP